MENASSRPKTFASLATGGLTTAERDQKSLVVAPYATHRWPRLGQHRRLKLGSVARKRRLHTRSDLSLFGLRGRYRTPRERCYEAVRQSCTALMLQETVVYMDRLSDQKAKTVPSTFFHSEREMQLQWGSSPKISDNEWGLGPCLTDWFDILDSSLWGVWRERCWIILMFPIHMGLGVRSGNTVVW